MSARSFVLNSAIHLQIQITLIRTNFSLQDVVHMSDTLLTSTQSRAKHVAQLHPIVTLSIPLLIPQPPPARITACQVVAFKFSYQELASSASACNAKQATGEIGAHRARAVCSVPGTKGYFGRTSSSLCVKKVGNQSLNSMAGIFPEQTLLRS